MRGFPMPAVSHPAALPVSFTMLRRSKLIVSGFD
jgi:hypothetical protein